jgi:4-hydroxythreonine-4-phosphate dehydrogenase
MLPLPQNNDAFSPPEIGITTGDPAGVGPEISLRAALNPGLPCCRLLLFGDEDMLRERASRLGLAWEFDRVAAEALAGTEPLPARGVVHIPALRERITLGQGSHASGEAAAGNIVACAQACLRGRLRAMVTAPLNKKYFNQAGYAFAGHTEFLAHLCGASRFAMAFLSENLKVVLATIHIPLQAAIAAISAPLILEKLDILLTEFPRLGLSCSRIAVAGLNPHAGEAGLMGREEIEHIEPALAQARARFPDIAIEGPVPADTLFHRAAQGEFDAVLALYHDQGLAPIKLLSFGEAVNVTLGLPFVRASVDHGTAYDIAEKGCARPDSMLSAIRWALRLSS